MRIDAIAGSSVVLAHGSPFIPHLTLVIGSLPEASDSTQWRQLVEDLVPLVDQLPDAVVCSGIACNEGTRGYVLMEIEESDDLRSLWAAARSSVRWAFVEDRSKEFAPHVTLGRVDSDKAAPLLKTLTSEGLSAERRLRPVALELSELGAHGTCTDSLLLATRETELEKRKPALVTGHPRRTSDSSAPLRATESLSERVDPHILETAGRLVSTLRQRLGTNVVYVGIHGSCVDMSDRLNADLDVHLVLTEIGEAEISAIHDCCDLVGPPRLQVMPFTRSEMEIFPGEYRLQFAEGRLGVEGDLNVPPPTRHDLIRYLHTRLFDRFLVPIRNFWLGQREYYSNDSRILVTRLVKEAYWWWRAYLYLDKSLYCLSVGELLHELAAIPPETAVSERVLASLRTGESGSAITYAVLQDVADEMRRAVAPYVRAEAREDA